MINNDKIRSKYFTIELYDESENINFNDKIELIKKYDYAYIRHDKDGVKTHIHCVVMFNNYRYLNAVSEEFDIPPNYIQKVRTLDSILTYLIHLNDKSKYQYDIKEVIGSINALEKLNKSYKNNGLEEENKILDLISYIDSCDYLTFTKFVKFACQIGRFDIVRRSQYLFIKLIEEHNNFYIDK